MKNVMVIDGAQNCTFPIFQATNAEFRKIFPRKGQDIEFVGDLVKRLGNPAAGKVLVPMWERPVLKPSIKGLHGTLFYEFEAKKKHFPKSKRECDWNPSAINQAQRDLYKSVSRKPHK